MSSSQAPSRSMLPIVLLSAAGFTVLTTEFVIVGLLPAIARDLKVSISQAGLLVTLFAFAVAAFGPFLTAYMARFKRRPLFVIVLFLFAVSNLLAAVAGNYAVMCVARLIPALLLPVFWALASETAVSIMGADKAGKAVSLVSFGVVAATIFGIPIGTLVGDAFGWRTAFWALAASAFLKSVLLFMCLPAIESPAKVESVFKQLGVLRSPIVVGHVILSLLVFAGMFTAYTYLADILETLGGFDGKSVGWILMGFGAFGLIGNWFGGRMVDRNPLWATIIFCAPLMVSFVLLVPFVKSYFALGIVLAIWGVTQAALFTVSHARVMKSAPESAALGASLNISGANMGIGLGAVVGGSVIDHMGLASVGWAAAWVVLAAILGTVMLMLASSKKEPTDEICEFAE